MCSISCKKTGRLFAVFINSRNCTKTSVGLCYSVVKQNRCGRNAQRRKSRRRIQQKFLSGMFRLRRKFQSCDSCLGKCVSLSILNSISENHVRSELTGDHNLI